MTNSKF